MMTPESQCSRCGATGWGDPCRVCRSPTMHLAEEACCTCPCCTWWKAALDRAVCEEREASIRRIEDMAAQAALARIAWERCLAPGGPYTMPLEIARQEQ